MLKICVNVSYLVIVAMVFAQNDLNKPKFRILAPQHVCPKDNEGDPIIVKPEETVIMLQTSAGAKLSMNWLVRWTPLVAPSQRFTLMLWRTVRELEKQLNAPQPEHNVYVIDNQQLLEGVEYNFTIIATTPEGVKSDPKTFAIDHSQGERKLQNVDGRSSLFSIILLGGQLTYPDEEFALEASVTMCSHTEDYHFTWTVQSVNHEPPHFVNVSYVAGSLLVVPARSLQPDTSYEAECQVLRTSSGEMVTQTGLIFRVERRKLQVQLNSDYLLVSRNTPFTVEATVYNHEFFNEQPKYQWWCTFDTEACEGLVGVDTDILNLFTGLQELGNYEIGVYVKVRDEEAKAKMNVEVVEAILPVLQVTPIPRVQNKGSVVKLEANATNVTPSCSLTWYFASDKFFFTPGLNDSCEDCQHGEPLSETLTIYSLEENFLNELTDYTNETEWRQVTAEMPAAAGRARFVAQCGCSLSFSCGTQGMVYADVNLEMNDSPKAGSISVSPTTGVALESWFRISTLSALDPDIPLRYSFYCGLGEGNALLLGYHYEHVAVDTFLPYIEGGTPVWVEVCDVFGACSQGPETTVPLAKGEGRTVSAFIEAAQAHTMRCDVVLLQRIAVSAFVTYTNNGLQQQLTNFSEALRLLLSGAEASHCSNLYSEQYQSFLQVLTGVGFK